jgi:dTDP-glucose pyrophosphorylase/predicted transcriptional regulator
MKDWRKALVRTGESLREVMRRIDAASLQIALVVDEEDHLVGTVTDGDIRRGILRGGGLDDPIDQVMNTKPTTVSHLQDSAAILTLMRNTRLHQVPVVEEGRVIGLETLDDLLSAPERDNPVVLMAGGRGTRLLPLTETTPKPMLHIGGRPILEHALVGLAEQGFRRFYIAINYLGEMVEDYLGDGSRWGVSIEYLRETKPMGTAGALSLMPEAPDKPFLVMNGDILTKLNFNQLMESHATGGASATVCVRNYDYQVPFGVTRFEDDRLVAIEEKPTMRHFVNAGIYVVEPEVLEHVPSDLFFDMPQLLDALMRKERPVHVFPITEYWLDIGRHDELQRAMREYGRDGA